MPAAAPPLTGNTMGFPAHSPKYTIAYLCHQHSTRCSQAAVFVQLLVMCVGWLLCR